jgi:hypothetical protein
MFVYIYLFQISVKGQLNPMELPFPIYYQGNTNLCWAACCEMVLVYDHNTVNQSGIVRWATGHEGNTPEGNVPTALWGTSPPRPVSEILQFMPLDAPADLKTVFYNKPQDYDRVEWNIRKNAPIFVGLMIKVNNSGHLVLIKGFYQGTKSLVYADPFKGTREVMLCSYFTDNPVSKWVQTLEIETVIVGPEDHVDIMSGPDLFTEPVTSTTTYTGYYTHVGGGPPPTIYWDWKLEFFYSDGSYIVPTGTHTDIGCNSTYTVLPFSLQMLGYQWMFNEAGNILGKITFSGDEAGYPHSDFKYVEYKPLNSFPDYVLYENRTISTSQPDVKTHSRVDLKNDQFLNGGNVSFKAGKTININSGITISNGSITNFVIDEALRY